MKFNYDGVEYEVRAAHFGQEFVVRVFSSGGPANGVAYSVTQEMAADAKRSGVDVVQDLKDIAKADFIRWSDALKSPELLED